MQTALIAERGGAAVAISGGFVDWATQYHDVIATLCTLVGCFVAIAGFVVHWWYLHRENVERRDDDK